ncbi:MAG: hypothetical protein MUE94_08155 [Verrucomicrobia bacterium]|nr:hypothetical protein [Verrucomicrobiota bacterium]
MKFNETRRSLKKIGVASLVLGLGFLPALATSTLITETIDFSNNSSNPTTVSPELAVGTNVIRGYVDGHTFGTDQDYFRVTLPSGARVAGIQLKVNNYSSTVPSSGLFEVLPTAAGNSGSVTVSGNLIEDLAYVIGAPTNIVLHAVAPFVVEMGATTSYSYEVQLLVAPIEAVAGTAIHTAVEITFPSEAGHHYQLQCVSDLGSDAWENVGDLIQGQGGTMSAFDTTRQAGQRFYRVIKP